MAWDGKGHCTKVRAVLGALCRYYYPGMVTFNGAEVAAHLWAHWSLKDNVEGDEEEDRTCRGAMWKGFWVMFGFTSIIFDVNFGCQCTYHNVITCRIAFV